MDNKGVSWERRKSVWYWFREVQKLKHWSWGTRKIFGLFFSEV